MSDVTLTAPEAPAAAETVTSTPTVAETMGAVWDKLNPPREAGKFVAQDAAQPTSEAAETPAKEAGTEATDQPATAAPDQAKPAIEAPASWSAEMKAKLSTLPPEHADIVRYAAQRDKEQADAISRMGQTVKQYEPIRSVVEQNAEVFRRNGVQPAEGVARMLAVESYLQTNPRAAIAELARAYGVDLGNAAPTPESEHVTRLERQVAQIEGKLTSQERAAQEAREADLSRAIETASKDLPHYEEVKSIIAGLLLSGEIPEADPAVMIKAAYERAVYAKPETRQRLQDEQRKADEAKSKAEAEKKAADARKAASLNARGSGASPTKPASMRDSMMAVADKHGYV